jgi:NAD-dependent dihydropyrimidine dehydrogenase PreA subunit
MGHIVNADREYRLLQRTFDRMVTGAPESPTFTKILKLLWSPEEAELARHLPSTPQPLDVLARKLGTPEDQLGDKLTEMAQRGVVLDLEIEGKRYFSLPPVVIGFFEMTFMRARDDMPMAELAHLFHEYMSGSDDRFARAVFPGKTQLGRSLIHEEALPQGDHIEVLDWERASHIIQSASALSVGLCQCRHKASHLGKACGKPPRACLTFNYSAKSMARCGYAQPITTSEAMGILQECKEAGLMQTGDNVQRNVSYICNCCGCCCGMIDAIKRFDLRHAIVTSNWIREVDLSKCKGCGKCAEVCPVGAIEIAEEGEGKQKRKWAVCDDSLCLGCGVCYPACKLGGIVMKPRAKRVFTPETTFDRIVSMAIERGKLANIIFDDPEKLSYRALGRVVNILEKSPPFRAAMAIEPLRSNFLKTVVKAAKKNSGALAKEMC